MNTNGSAQRVLIVNAMFVALLCAYAFWLIAIDGDYYKPVIEYWPGCFTPSKEVFHPGEEITLRTIATKNRTLVGQVSWSLVNTKTHQVIASFLTRPTVMKKGYNDAVVTVAIAPLHIEDGEYFMSGMVTYAVNPLKEVAYSLESAPFKILNVKENGS